MAEEEGLFEVYYERVIESETPSKMLSEFYSRLFDVPITYKTVITFGRLVKLYGRVAVFYALTSMFTMDDINHDNILPLLSYFSKQFFENKPNKINDLTNLVEDIETKKEKLSHKKLNLKDTLDE